MNMLSHLLRFQKLQGVGTDSFKIYMAGLACVMKRINVIPKNNFVKIRGVK